MGGVKWHLKQPVVEMQFSTVGGSCQSFLKPDEPLTWQLRLMSRKMLPHKRRQKTLMLHRPTLEPVDAQAPVEVQEATGAQEPLEVPETDVAQAQFEALEAADAQATAEVPEVGAQAPLEVPEVVDVTAQEVADEQATANVDTTADDDDHAAALLDAAGPTQ
ncbi:hypothetical protein AC1031_003564 [Aphanomyces cochlioides]|nr:hypothetical protein AC1031_003564 [Aphanomyces cochlioides]